MARVDHDRTFISMIGKSASEVWPIAKDETRARVEESSANGAIRQEMLVLDEGQLNRQGSCSN